MNSIACVSGIRQVNVSQVEVKDFFLPHFFAILFSVERSPGRRHWFDGSEERRKDLVVCQLLEHVRE